MTRQTQRLITNISVFITGLALAVIVGLLTYYDKTVPQILVAALGSSVTLYGFIVRDNRNRSDIDKDELDAEVSREQRVKASEREMRSFVMGEDAIKEQVVKEMRKLNEKQ